MKKYEEAEQDYLSGLKYKDIADKYGVSISTVKSWKSRYWNSDKVATKDKKVAQEVAKVAKQKPTEKAIEELSDSTLTDKQKDFALNYLRTSNATQSYINAYGVGYKTATSSGPRLLGNDRVKAEIERLRKARVQERGINAFDLIDDMIVEARADIGDYVDFGKYNILNVNGTGEVQLDTEDNPEIFHKSWVQFKDKDMIDTKAIKSIRIGKDGPVIELHDRNKARQELLNYLDKRATDSDDVQVIGFDRRSEEDERS